jgi:O-antigen biosynthesis protein WbqP
MRTTTKAICLIGSLATVLSVIGYIDKPRSVYKDKPEEQNPFKGKKVKFIEDLSKEENADGYRGYLVAVGDTSHSEGLYERIIKRFFDIVLSFAAIVLLSPSLMFISLWIFIDDPGPVIFTQKRVGKDKEFFKLHKFRSMKMSTPPSVPTHMMEHSERYITKAGAFIRSHSLDELPQIWDIFIGNMSVIGPRPALWNQDLLISERDKYGANETKPGLTGWAQINGRDTLEIPKKAELDGEYCNKIGLKMDVKCFLKSLGVFGTDKSVVEGGIIEKSRERNCK